MKKTLSLFLSLIMVLGVITSMPLTVNAASVSDLTFELNEDGESYSVADCAESAEGELIIPDTYNGLPVTNIDSWSFSNCNKLVSVIIGNGVNNIGDYALGWCNSLKSVTIPYSITSIGDKAFSDCTSLEKVYWNAKSVEDFLAYSDAFSRAGISSSGIEFVFGNSVEKIPSYLCYISNLSYLPKIKSITISDTVTRIGDYAFRNCTSLTSVTVPDNVKDIGKWAFGGCTNLNNITIPDNVIKIGESAFYSTGYYRNTDNWENNALYINNHLIEAKSSISGNYVIKADTKNIADYAFYYCTELTSITIPDSVERIGNYALGYCYPEVKIDNFTIIGESSSIAERYANENGFKFVNINHPHIFSAWITDQEATVNSAGSKHKECTECGEVLKTATIKQLKCSKAKLKKVANTATGVKITWGKVSGADSYEVYRKVKGGSYSKVGTTSKTYFTDKKAKSGKTYYYVVKAVNEAGKSSNSNYKTIKYLADPVLKTPTSAKKGITLKWTKTTGAQGYIVYRKTGSGSYSKLTTVKGVSKLSYVDKTAKKNKKYTYKVKAYYGKTYSAYSNTKTIKDKY